MNKRKADLWRCHWDPTGHFSGEFSGLEFKLGIASGIWPTDSVWYSYRSKRWYRITQTTSIFRSVQVMSAHISNTKRKVASGNHVSILGGA